METNFAKAIETAYKASIESAATSDAIIAPVKLRGFLVHLLKQTLSEGVDNVGYKREPRRYQLMLVAKTLVALPRNYIATKVADDAIQVIIECISHRLHIVNAVKIEYLRDQTSPLASLK